MSSKLQTLPLLVAIAGIRVFADTVTVDATADIYSAGHAALPSTVFPGTFAPEVSVPSPTDQLLTFSSVTGLVGCNFTITNGPDGTCFPGVNTRVLSYGGLSGISAYAANFFLVGVFLDAAEPSGTGPAVLGYDSGSGLTTRDASYTPALDQVFFIGDGLTGTGTGREQQFYLPAGATRFYLGFADSFDSYPSYYGDNVGSLDATFQFSAPTPEPSTLFLGTFGAVCAAVLWRRRIAKL